MACLWVFLGWFSVGNQSPPKDTQPGDRWQLVLKDGTEFPFRYCPPGRFLMGSPIAETERIKARVNDRPTVWNYDETQREVTLTYGFWIAETELTLQQYWSILILSTPKVGTVADREESIRQFMGEEAARRFKGWVVDDAHAQHNIQWREVYHVSRQLHDLAGLLDWEFRLPTEAEWEYACRAGNSGPFPTDNMEDSVLYGGNDPQWQVNPSEEVVYHPPVKTKSPNAWGIYDMHGGVAEYCMDWFNPYAETINYFRVFAREKANPVGLLLGQQITLISHQNPMAEAQGKPFTNPKTKVITFDSDKKMVRGGGFTSTAPECRAARRTAREYFKPQHGVGVRLVLAPKGLLNFGKQPAFKGY